MQGKFVIIANSFFFYERTKQQKPWRTRVSTSVMNASHALRTILNEQKCIFLKWICNALDYRSGKRMTLLKLFIDECTMLEHRFFSFLFCFFAIWIQPDIWAYKYFLFPHQNDQQSHWILGVSMWKCELLCLTETISEQSNKLENIRHKK